MRSLVLVSILVVGGCGGDDGGGSPAADAFVSHVTMATCAGTEMTIGTKGTGTSADPYAYDPAALTIATGAAVKFSLQPIHSVAPDAGNDPGLNVDFGGTKCLKFDAPGTYKFHCSAHPFHGTITVQ